MAHDQSTSDIQDLPDHPFQPTTFRYRLGKQLLERSYLHGFIVGSG